MSFVTPNMTLTLPSVGPSGDTGPTWAALLDAALQAVDAHTHAPGSGAPIPTAGLNINADLSFNQFALSSVYSLRFAARSATVADRTATYSVNGDLYWNNASGTPVQITSGSGINISSVKGFGGDYGQAGVTAAANFTNSTHTFSFTSSSGIAALMNVGTLLISAPSAGASPISLAAPSGATSYTLTLPAASPTANQQLISDGSGNLAWTTTTGTANQVAVTFTTGAVTLSLPQNIHTGASPAFVGLSLTGALSAAFITSSGNASVTGTASVGSLVTAAITNGGAGVVFGNTDPVSTPAGLRSATADTPIKFRYYTGTVASLASVSISVSGATTILGMYGACQSTGTPIGYITAGAGNLYFAFTIAATSILLTSTNGVGPETYAVVVWYV